MAALRALFAIVALALLACASPEERAAGHMERGEHLLGQGEVRAALLEFQSALKLRSDDAALYERIGDVLFERSQSFLEALPYYEEAYNLDPTRIHSAMRMARVLVFDDPDRARELMKVGLAEAPDDPVVQRALAHISLVQGKPKRALTAANRAVRLGPDDPPNWAQLGTVQMALIGGQQQRGRRAPDHMFSSALRSFRMVDRAKGGAYSRAWLEKGRVYGFWGKRLQAERTFRRAIELAKAQDAPIEVRFAAVATEGYAQRSDNPQLLEYALRELVAADPDDYGAWERLAEVSERLPGKDAEGVFRELLELQPEASAAHLAYTSWLVEQERNEEAEAHLLRTMADGVDAPALGEGRVRLALRRKDLPAAKQALADLVDAHPEAVPTRVAEARIQLAEGRVGDATRNLRKVVARREELWEAQRLLALASHRMGDRKLAERAIEQAYRDAPPPQLAVLRLRGRIAVENGRWHRAIESFEKVLDAGGKLSVSERAEYAIALHETGRPEEGSEHLQQLIGLQPPPPVVALAFARYEGAKHPDRALTGLTKTARAFPVDVAVQRVLVDFERERGLAKEAIERLGGLIEAGKARPETLLLRAELLAQGGAYEHAEADVLRAFEANPSLPGALELLESLYAAQGKLEEARRSFEQADEAGVLHPGARLLLARLYLGEGDTARAREALEQVVAAAPDLWLARSDLARVLALRGEELERAETLAAEAVELSLQAPQARDALGLVRLEGGEAGDALKEFGAAIATMKRSHEAVPPRLHYHRGLALRALGRDGAAVRAFEVALGGGDFPEAEAARQQLEATRASASAADDAS